MLSKKTKLLYVTGTRADYGLMRHTLLTLDSLLNLKIVVTGMHLDHRFGHTLTEIKKDKLKILKQLPLPFATDLSQDLPGNLGYLLDQLGCLLTKNNFNYVLVEGDRIEALAMAITANCYNTPVIHQGGGDASGSIDDSIRNAITSFSNYHLVGNTDSARRLLLKGIDKKTIFQFGEPGLDDITRTQYTQPQEIFERFNIDKSKPLILASLHPNTKDKKSPVAQIKPFLQALCEAEIPTILIYPNNDPGGLKMITEIEKYRRLRFLTIYPSIPRADFLGLMKISQLMVGNSSAGLVEATLFNLPFVNIGERQKGRLRDVNVINCANDKNLIIMKIKANLNKKNTFVCKKVYGTGHFTEKFIKFMEKL